MPGGGREERLLPGGEHLDSCFQGELVEAGPGVPVHVCLEGHLPGCETSGRFLTIGIGRRNDTHRKVG